MGIEVIERVESRTETHAIVCEEIERTEDNTQFIVSRTNIVSPVDTQSIELNDINEVRDLRNLLNEMLDAVGEPR